jgi:hypothetical protein
MIVRCTLEKQTEKEENLTVTVTMKGNKITVVNYNFNIKTSANNREHVD